MVQDLVSMLMRKYYAEMKFYQEIVMPRFFFFLVYCIPKQERPYGQRPC